MSRWYLEGQCLPFQRDVKLIPNLARYPLSPWVSFQQLMRYKSLQSNVHFTQLHGILSQSFFLYRNHKNAAFFND